MQPKEYTPLRRFYASFGFLALAGLLVLGTVEISMWLWRAHDYVQAMVPNY